MIQYNQLSLFVEIQSICRRKHIEIDRQRDIKPPQWFSGAQNTDKQQISKGCPNTKQEHLANSAKQINSVFVLFHLVAESGLPCSVYRQIHEFEVHWHWLTFLSLLTAHTSTGCIQSFLRTYVITTFVLFFKRLSY